MTESSTLGARLKQAMLAYAARQPGRRTSHADFGAAVAAVEGRDGPYAADTVFAWLNDKLVPPYATALAIAELGRRRTNAQIAELLYGPEHPIHGLNESDYNRFHNAE